MLAVQVVPITNAEVKKRIHQTYRMGYIKDVILPRVGPHHDPQNTQICLFQWSRQPDYKVSPYWGHDIQPPERIYACKS